MVGFTIYCAILLKPHKKEEETTLKERLGTAYKAAAETYAEGYKGAFARILRSANRNSG